MKLNLHAFLGFLAFTQFENCNSTSVTGYLKNVYTKLFPWSSTPDGVCVPIHLLDSTISELHQSRKSCLVNWKNLHNIMNEALQNYHVSTTLLRKVAAGCPKSEKYCKGIIEYKEKSGEFKHDIDKLNGGFQKFDTLAVQILQGVQTTLGKGSEGCSVDGGRIVRSSADSTSARNVYIPSISCTKAKTLGKEAHESISPAEGAAAKVGELIGHGVMFMTLKIPELEEVAQKDESALNLDGFQEFKKSVNSLQNTLKKVVRVSGAEACDAYQLNLDALVDAVCGRSTKASE